MKKINLFFAAIFIAAFVHSQTVATFENLTLGADTFWNGSDLSGGFASGNAFFYNSYDTAYGGAWSGFSYSDKTDTVTPGYANQYSAITGSGYSGSANYAVADEYGNAKVRLIGAGAGKVISGFYVTNSTYAYRSMLNGDQFSKKFGGITGTDPDWFRLTATGWYKGSPVPDSVVFYLADYRDTAANKKYIVENWRWVDLAPLGNVDSIQFFLSSSDTGAYGMNTPAYFCIDNFTTTDSLSLTPVANNDYVIINYEQDTLINVLANDYSPSGSPLTVNLISGPFVPGAIANDSAGGIYYIPAVGIVTTDLLIYTACDSNNLCDTAIVFITINSLTSGVKDVSLESVNVAPNPFTSSFTIHHSPDVEKIIIYDMQCKVVKEMVCNDYTGKTEVNGGDLPSGAYFARLVSANASSVIKLIKQ